MVCCCIGKQWGLVLKNSSTLTITLPLSLGNSNYKVFTQQNPRNGFESGWANTQYPQTQNNNSFIIKTPYGETANNMYIYWFVIAF